MSSRALPRVLLLLTGVAAAVNAEILCNSEDCSAPATGGSLLQVRKETPSTVSSPLEGSEQAQPHVCIIARTCGPMADCKPASGAVRAFLASIAAQSYTEWELHLVNAQGGGEVFEPLVQTFSDHRIRNGPSPPNRFAENTWGYEATNYALEKLLAGGGNCQYFLFTNADNLYGRGFLESGLPGMREGRDLLGFNFVTRYVQPSTMKPHMPMADAGFTYGHIDLGAVLVSGKTLQESGIRFDPAHNVTTDWSFFEEVINRTGATTAFYPELHYIHQLLQVNSSQSSHAAMRSPFAQTLKREPDRSTLFYHVHVPRTGGTTVANLLVDDICNPYNETIAWNYEDDDSLCAQPCSMGLTDNELSCFPGRLEVEHQPFSISRERAEGLMTASGAQKTIYVTTLRRGSERLKSQWALEAATKHWVPSEDVPVESNRSLQLYLNGADNHATGWGWSARSPSQRNNLQVAQLASINPASDTVVTREHLEMAKQTLLKGDWLIGFTKCLDKVHSKLTLFAKSVHEGLADRELQRGFGHEADQDVLDAETDALLHSQCALDNELFEWAWGLAAAGEDQRFAGTC